MFRSSRIGLPAVLSGFVLATALASFGSALTAGTASAACADDFVGTIGTATTYSYCGAQQTFVAPPGATGITVTAIGGGGGGGANGGRVVSPTIGLVMPCCLAARRKRALSSSFR